MKIPDSRLTLHRRSLCASRFLAAGPRLLVIVLSLFCLVGIALEAQQVTPKRVEVPTEMITVQPGQTLADLAEKYFGDRRQYKKFLEYNNIPDINSMKPGDRLQVPVNSNESTNLDQVAPNAEAGKSATSAAESIPTLPVAESTNQTTFDSLQTAEIEAVPELAPPTEVKANDVPNDAIKKGRGAIIITWTAPEDTTNLKGYHVWRQAMPDGDFEKITKKPLNSSNSEYLDKTATGGQSYVYQVASVGGEGASGAPGVAEVVSVASKPAIAQGNWYNTKKSYLLLTIIVFSIISLYYMDRGMSGKDMFIRRIAALDTIEEVVGRYPYADTYTMYPGPNSNTFTAWVGRYVPELKLDLPPTAIGKDYLGYSLVAAAPSGTGFQVSVLGLFGILAGVEEGLGPVDEGGGTAAGLDRHAREPQGRSLVAGGRLAGAEGQQFEGRVAEAEQPHVLGQRVDRCFPVAFMHDQLGDHRIVKRRDRVALHHRAVCADRVG